MRQSDPSLAAYTEITYYQLEGPLNHVGLYPGMSQDAAPQILLAASTAVRQSETQALQGTAIQPTPILVAASFDFELVRQGAIAGIRLDPAVEQMAQDSLRQFLTPLATAPDIEAINIEWFPRSISSGDVDRFAALLRVLTVGLGEESIRNQWIGLLSVIAILTMIVGNVVALAQQNIKRMLAYSSIANAGYLLVAVVAGGRAGNGTATVFFYLAAYAFMTVGAFAVATLLGSAGEEDEGYSLSAFAGLSRRRPYLAAAMAIFMLSLTGIPPTGGFMGKFYIFKSAVDAGMYGLAAVGLLASVVGAFYYLRVVVQMYLREPAGHAPPLLVGRAEALAILIAALGTLWIGLFPSGLLAFAQHLGS